MEVLGNLPQLSSHLQSGETRLRDSLSITAPKGSAPDHPSLLSIALWELPWGFKEVAFTPREGPIKLGLAWDGIRHQEPDKQQASGEGQEGGPTGPSGPTLPVPNLTLTEAGVSDRFYARWFSHGVFSLIRQAVVINTGERIHARIFSQQV